MKEIRLGICGLGTVGGGVLDLIKSNADRLYDQVGAPIKVVKIGSRSKKPLFNDEEISECYTNMEEFIPKALLVVYSDMEENANDL